MVKVQILALPYKSIPSFEEICFFQTWKIILYTAIYRNKIKIRNQFLHFSVQEYLFLIKGSQ